MSLTTGRRLHRDQWTELPMPAEAVARVNAMGRKQRMPESIVFQDQYGFIHPWEEIESEDSDDDDDDDSPDDNDDDSSDDSE